jgi:transcriptional regulator with PAS, ATPase and Fis domain
MLDKWEDRFMNAFFKSVIDQDRAPVVICDLNHVIVYMNPVAEKNYEKWGGADLVGKSLMDCHNEKSREAIEKVVEWFKESVENNIIYTFYNEKQNKDVYMVALRDDTGELIGYYEKHEYRNREMMERYDYGDKC